MLSIPRIAIGTWRLPKNFNTISCINYAFTKCGYRHIDCASYYYNQDYIGKALATVFDNSDLKRKDIWVTSKLSPIEMEPENVEKYCRKTIKQLGIDYLDLYLIHWATPLQRVIGTDQFMKDKNGQEIPSQVIGNHRILDVWQAMENLVHKGLVRNIGVSNFGITLLEKMRYSPKVHIQPYCNQIELQLYMQQEPLVKYCASRKINVMGFGTLGRPLPDRNGVSLLSDPVLNQVAKEIGRSPAQVLIKFEQQLYPNLVPVVMSQNKVHIKQNRSLDFVLSSVQMKRLKSREKCFRFVNPSYEWGFDYFGDLW